MKRRTAMWRVDPELTMGGPSSIKAYEIPQEWRGDKYKFTVVLRIAESGEEFFEVSKVQSVDPKSGEWSDTPHGTRKMAREDVELNGLLRGRYDREIVPVVEESNLEFYGFMSPDVIPPSQAEIEAIIIERERKAPREDPE